MTKHLRVLVLFLAMLCMLSLPAVQCNGSNHTAALWLFDENTGNIAYDSSPNGNNGTIYGATWVHGKFNYALEFDGSDDYVEVPDSSSLNLTEEVTIEAWVNWRGAGDSWQTIVAKGIYPSSSNESYALFINRDGKYVCFVLTTDTRHYFSSPLNSVPVGMWFHVMATYNGTDGVAKIYLNARLVATETLSGSLLTNDQSLRIGHREGSNHYFNGTLDKVRIGNKAAIPHKILGDVNGDGKVDIQDVALVAFAFGSYPGHLRWNPDCDFNGDGRVDIRDIVIVAKEFGKTWS